MSKFEKYICEICKLECKSLASLSGHIRNHGIFVKEYYDKYIRKPNEGICLKCGKQTKFRGMREGYKLHCSVLCGNTSDYTVKRKEATLMKKYGVKHNFQAKECLEKREQTWLKKYGVKNVSQSPKIQAKTRQTNLERYGTIYAVQHPSIREKISKGQSTPQAKEKARQTNLERYGVDHPFKNEKVREKSKATRKARYNDPNYTNREKAVNTFKENIEKIEQKYNCTAFMNLDTDRYDIRCVVFLPTFKKHDSCFILNKYLPTLEKITSYSSKSMSMQEAYLKYRLESLNIEIIFNSRSIIKPLELDVYLPKYNIAIECNGIYYHSLEAGRPKNYHLNKSLLCREIGIRLIHIHEFEDLKKQIQLVIDLINGQDNYPKKDFNKNNLIENIPKPEIVYKDNSYTVYGSGHLYDEKEEIIIYGEK